MTLNPLPPQAYTKDILLKAYQWLMSQNSNIKEIATTPDSLVSLYLKAIRDGDSSLDRPSIQNFKNELRSLAGMMGELDKSPAATLQSPTVKDYINPPKYNQTNPNTNSSPINPYSSSQNHPMNPSYPSMTHQMPQAINQNIALSPVQNFGINAVPVSLQNSAPSLAEASFAEAPTARTLTAPSAELIMDVFDKGTFTMIQEVKQEFNLSSDMETVRMLIKFGYIKSKDMLK
jgi:hypothetical protein